jgi:hypothetical protein
LEKAFTDFRIDEVYDRSTFDLTKINAMDLVPRTPKTKDIKSAISIDFEEGS